MGRTLDNEDLLELEKEKQRLDIRHKKIKDNGQREQEEDQHEKTQDDMREKTVEDKCRKNGEEKGNICFDKDTHTSLDYQGEIKLLEEEGRMETEVQDMIAKKVEEGPK